MVRNARRVCAVIVMVGLIACARQARADDTGKEWLNEVLVQIAPGPDALGERVPGAWYSRDGSKIEVTEEVAFAGKRSLRIELRRTSGGCNRMARLPRGKDEIELSCQVFVPKGQVFSDPPAVAIWRSVREQVARAEPVKEVGRWVESVLRFERPSGRSFYVGVSASSDAEQLPFFYVDCFALKADGETHDVFENPGFEEETGDRRGDLIADFDPDLVNVWRADKLNADGLFSRHGVRIASWGRVEYDAAIDWEKRLEEFKAQAAKHDIDGNAVTWPSHPPFVNRMCHHSPVWHEHQKAGLTSIVGDNDALAQDNICNPSFRTRDACFCEFCERDFRTHLKERFSAEELAQLVPGPVDEFSIRQHVKSIRADHPGMTILDDPLAREFVRCQYLYGKRFLADIAEAIRQEAEAEGRVVPFFGNQGAPWGGGQMPVCSVAIADVVDVQVLETFLFQPYRQLVRHAWGSLQYRLMRAATCNRKPVWPLLPPSEPRQFPTGAHLYVAEALSNGAVPLLIWSAMSFPTRHVYEVHSRYAKLLNENRALFLDREPLAQVGLVYSLPSSFWRYFHSYALTGGDHGRWLGTVARMLEDAHIPHEVIVFGHPDLLDDEEQLGGMDDCDALILAGVDCLSDKQAAAIRKFAEQGGRLLVIGDLGTRDEEYVPRETALLSELADDEAVGQRVAVLPDTVITEYRSTKTEAAAVEEALASFRDAVEGALGEPRLLGTDAPETLWLTVWQDASGRRISVHMVNYDVDLERSEFRAVRDVNATIRVPTDFRFNRVRLLGPGAAEHDVAFERDGDLVSFRIPEVTCYAIAALTTDNELDAANVIAKARRNIDRAHVAARATEATVDDGVVRAQLAEAQSSHEQGEFAQALETAQAALEASEALLTR